MRFSIDATYESVTHDAIDSALREAGIHAPYSCVSAAAAAVTRCLDLPLTAPFEDVQHRILYEAASTLMDRTLHSMTIDEANILQPVAEQVWEVLHQFRPTPRRRRNPRLEAAQRKFA